jgi:hypothetical protein
MAMSEKIPELSGLLWCDLHSFTHRTLEDFQIEQSLDSDEKEGLRRKAWPNFRSPELFELLDDARGQI